MSFGALQAIISVVGAIFSRAADELAGREIWLKFATWILLALEFALAADLVRTAVAPTWEDIAKLAVIATIRTMLNYFLAKDIAAFDAAKATAQNPAQGPNLYRFCRLFMGPPLANMVEWRVTGAAPPLGGARVRGPAFLLGIEKRPGSV